MLQAVILDKLSNACYEPEADMVSFITLDVRFNFGAVMEGETRLIDYMEGLPDGLDAQSITPHERHSWARDHTVFNVDGSRFAVAFNVYEHTMMNEVGLFAWGVINDGKLKIIGHIHNLFVHCWEQPFANWITATAFVVKVSSKRNNFPLLAVDFEKGFQIIPDSFEVSSRPSGVIAKDLATDHWGSKAKLMRALN